MKEIDDASWMGGIFLIVIIGLFAYGIHEYNRVKERQAYYARAMLDFAEVKREVIGESFTAERYTSCDKGSGRSWRQYTGQHLADVTVTPVRITYASGRVEETEAIDGPSKYVPCVWRTSESPQ